MKNDNAPGDDKIVIEAVKLAGEAFLEKIKDLFN